MPEFISDVIYSLKHEYGTRLQLRNVTGETQDILTGIKTVTGQVVVNVPRAVRLPNQVSLEFAQRLAGNSKGLQSLVGTFQILCDRKDVPASFDFYPNKTTGTYDGKIIEIQHADVFDEAVILHVIERKGVPSV